MEQLDMLIIGSSILTSIALGLVILLVVRIIVLKKQLKQLAQVKSRNKKKRQKQRSQQHKKEKVVNSSVKLLFLVLFLGVVSAGVAGYSYYYQQTNLNPNDREALVEGTLYVNKIEGLLEKVTDGQEEEKKEANIREIASHMSSFSFKKADYRVSSKAQVILNRYYKDIGQLGINLANETVEHLKNDGELVSAYQKDIERIVQIEQQIYAFYGIKKVD